MIENLKQLVLENVQKSIVQNNDIPNEQNDLAIDAASSSIVETLKDQLASGNITNLIEAFKDGNVKDSAMAQQAMSAFTEKLDQLGINPNVAQNLASNVIPGIMDKFVNKTNDPNDNSFNISDMISEIAGPDGKFQLTDLVNLLGNDSNGQSNIGGLLGKLKSFFK